jgi:hypothetical protein
MEPSNTPKVVSQKKDEEVVDSLETIKLRALKEGKFTDCTFVVGPDDGPQEVKIKRSVA